MKKIIRCLFLFLLLSGTGWAQQPANPRLDSLLAELGKTGPDTNRVKLLNDISYELCYTNPTEGLVYGKQSLELAGKLLWDLGIGNAKAAIGSNYANKADYAKALEFEYDALKDFEKLKNIRKQAIMWRNIAIVHKRMRDYPKAIECNEKAMNLYRGLNDTEGIAAIHGNIANVYYDLNKKEKVIEHNLEALEIYTASGNERGRARMLGNIANFYAEEGEFARAMVYYFDALRKETALKNLTGVMRNSGNIGETYLDIYRDTTGLIQPDSLIPRGKAANLKKALQFLEDAVRMAKELEQVGYYISYGNSLSEAYSISGKFREAFELYRECSLLNDSVYDVENMQEATRREYDYEYGKREDSLTFEKKLGDVKLLDEQLLRSRQRLYFLIGLCLVLVFSGFMFNRWRVTQRQKRIIEAEQKRSEELLLNILPAETAKELKEKGRADARLYDQVTVLFTDFKEFTQLSELLPPEKLVAEINTCFSAFDAIVGKYGIEKIKTIGDAYMAAGGLPAINQTHAEDVVNAALDIRDFMLEYAEKKKAANQPFFRIRIGVHTGPVVAGIVGIKKFQYDIWGDTVNTASRMESSGEPEKVNISQSTYERVRDKFNCTYRGKISAKNKGEVDMYFVEHLET